MNKLPAEDVTYLACIWEKLHADRDLVLSQRYVEITILRVFKASSGQCYYKIEIRNPKGFTEHWVPEEIFSKYTRTNENQFKKIEIIDELPSPKLKQRLYFDSE